MKKRWLLPAMLLAAVCIFAPSRTMAATTVNVLDMGAAPNDGVGDGQAIQKALDLAKGNSELVTVYVPAGTYEIDKCLNIYSDTYFQLDKDAKMVRTDSALDKNLLHATDDNTRMDAVGGYDMCENITVDGGVWDGGNAEKSDSGHDLMRFDHGKNITVKNASFKNVYDCHELGLIAIKNGLVENCTFSDFHYNRDHKNQLEYGREAIQIESAWTNNPGNLKDESSYWASGTMIDGTHCEDITVRGCTFTDYPTCVGQHHYSDSAKYSNSKNIRIENNTITAGSQYTYFKIAIPCAGLDNVTISGNQIVGPYRFAIFVKKAANVSITGNGIKNSSNNGIDVEGGTVTDLSENVLTNIGRNAVSVSGGTVGSASGDTGLRNNTITAAKGNGVCISGKAKVYHLSGNTIAKSKKSGIFIEGSAVVGTKGKAESGIYGNTITGSRVNGISIYGGKVGYVKANTVNRTKKNAISFGKGKVQAIQSNKIKKAKNGIYIAKKKNLKKKNLSSNKIKKCRRKIL